MVVSRGDGVGREVLEAARAVRASLPTHRADLAARHAAAVAALANVLGRIPTSTEVKPELVEPLSRAFVQAVRHELEQLADEVARALHAKCAHLDHPTSPALEELARQRGRWIRDARIALQPVAAHLAGWVDGGALAWALREGPREVSALRAELVARTRFVEQQANVALEGWLERAEHDATLSSSSSPLASPEAEAQAEAATRATPAERLATLLAKAADLGVRIRNAPDNPSERYLDKLAVQLAEVEQKRAAAAPPPEPVSPPGDRNRLAVLLSFADELKVKVRAVPDSPTATWLDKMEAKLVEVAERRSVPIPLSLRPQAETGTQPVSSPAPVPVPAPSAAPPPAEPAPAARTPTVPTPSAKRAPAPEVPTRGDAMAPQPLVTAPHVPDRIEVGATMEAVLPPVDEERRARIENLLERAAETGLELGRVPPDPSDTWVGETEAKLDAAIERRKTERRAERKRREAERQVRVEWVREQSEALGIDIGAIPAFPTDDWLARAEVRLQAAVDGPQRGSVGPEDSGRARRLEAVLEAATAAEVDLGEVPPDPDEVWIVWAEGQVDRETGADEAIPLASEGFEVSNGYLIYEEGTVQEQVYTVSEELEVSVGRGRGNTVQIRDDAGVSRRHCTIRLERGRFWLRDEGSTKGTLVNGMREQEIELSGDEQVQCGETQFMFRIR